jgi:hypothetical protein
LRRCFAENLKQADANSHLYKLPSKISDLYLTNRGKAKIAD